MIFFDSYAILEIIQGNEEYKKFGESIFTTNTLNLAEVFYSLLREINIETANEIINKLDFEFMEISEEIALESAMFRYKNKSRNLSYADCIGYITALKNNMKFLTGDKEFKDMENVVFVK